MAPRAAAAASPSSCASSPQLRQAAYPLLDLHQRIKTLRTRSQDSSYKTPRIPRTRKPDLYSSVSRRPPPSRRSSWTRPPPNPPRPSRAQTTWATPGVPPGQGRGSDRPNRARDSCPIRTGRRGGSPWGASAEGRMRKGSRRRRTWRPGAWRRSSGESPPSRRVRRRRGEGFSPLVSSPPERKFYVGKWMVSTVFLLFGISLLFIRKISSFYFLPFYLGGVRCVMRCGADLCRFI